MQREIRLLEKNKSRSTAENTSFKLDYSQRENKKCLVSVKKEDVFDGRVVTECFLMSRCICGEWLTPTVIYHYLKQINSATHQHK